MVAVVEQGEGCGNEEEQVELGAFGEELGEGEVADGPVGLAEEGEDGGEIGGSDDADGGEIGERGEEDGPGFGAGEGVEQGAAEAGCAEG